MIEARVRFPQLYVSPEEKLRREREAEQQQQRYLAMMASGTLPPGLEMREIPPTVAGQAPRIEYRYPSKMRKITASQRAAAAAAARKNTATTTTAGTSALVGGSVLPGESSETLVENLKLEEIRISN